MYDYQSKVERVVDGDTVRMTIDHGMFIRSSQSIRLLGVLAPELGKPGGTDARAFVIGWFSNHSHHSHHGEWAFLVVTQKDKQTFNRYVGVVICQACQAVLNMDVITHLGAT